MIIWGKEDIFTLLFLSIQRHCLLCYLFKSLSYTSNSELQSKNDYFFGENIMVRNVLEAVNIKLAVYAVKCKSQH